MKTIAFLRHAKSDWGSAELADIDRPLAERGLHDAPKIGAWLTERITFDQALLSPARRAQQTFQALKLEIPTTTIESLYPTQAGNAVRLLQRQSNDLQTILIIGHNPGISRTVNTLLSQIGDDPKLEEMPTCAVAILQSPISNWSELNFGQATLQDFITPKRLAKGK